MEGKNQKTRVIPVVLGLLLSGTSVAKAASTFMGLGDLPGGEFVSQAWGVSADGSTVVGSSLSDKGQEAFRWTKQSGMQGLGGLSLSQKRFVSVASAVSADGSVVVGASMSGNGVQAYRWIDGIGQPLGG